MSLCKCFHICCFWTGVPFRPDIYDFLLFFSCFPLPFCSLPCPGGMWCHQTWQERLYDPGEANCHRLYHGMLLNPAGSWAFSPHPVFHPAVFRPLCKTSPAVPLWKCLSSCLSGSEADESGLPPGYIPAVHRWLRSRMHWRGPLRQVLSSYGFSAILLLIIT